MEKQISNYQITKTIGKGGMGSVYLGHFIDNPQIRVAVKELNIDQATDTSLRARFQREAEALAKMKHRNIVRFYDFKYVDGFFYLVMEFVEGRTLSEYLCSLSKPLTPNEAVAIMVQILDAFQYAHSLGIIHRDIKPNNIMITPHNEIKILDFGIAKINNAKANLTQVGTVLGTPVYMSPEQIRGFTTDHRSDVYSLGVLFFYLLAGQMPYDEQKSSHYDIEQSIVNKTLPRLKDYVKDIPEYLQTVIDKATEKDLRKRFQNCSDFMNALRDDTATEKSKTSCGKTITIGRDPSCSIVIIDNSISRKHAEITICNGQYELLDTSTNGTVIDGHTIQGAKCAVSAGKQVLLAGKVPLPWEQVYVFLPLRTAEPSTQKIQTTEPVVPAKDLSQSKPDAAVMEYLRPKNYKIESVLVMVFCGILWGLIAYSYASKVDRFYDNGHVDTANEYSRKAKNWCVTGIVVLGVLVVIQILSIS